MIVTLPALVLSEVLSNLSWPLESAASWRLLEAPPPPLELAGFGVVVAGAAAAVVLVDAVELFELELLLLPQPATASAASAAQHESAQLHCASPVCR